MKKLILITLLLASSAGAATQDSLCLSMAHVGATIAEARLEGTTEATMLTLPQTVWKNPGKPTPMERRTAEMGRLMIQYVFTMRLKPADARQMVYLKCLAGDFGRY